MTSTSRTAQPTHPTASARPELRGPLNRFAGLDGLRAIAVILVILYHATPGGVVGGYLGVDVFFVISGFLITSLIVDERERDGSVRLGGFWLRRARRLLPALVLVILVAGSVALAIGGDVLLRLGSQVLGALTFSANWLSIAQGSSYFSESTPEILRHVWSLAIEEQFYLVWPLMLLALLAVPKRWLRVAIVTLAGVVSAVAMALLVVPGADATRVYYGTDTHAFGLLAGAALALGARAWPRALLEWPRGLRLALQLGGSISVAAMVALAVTMRADGTAPYRGGLALVAVLTVLAIAGSIVPSSLLGRILDLRPIAWIGERSYGLYLWHWPVIVLGVAAVPELARSWWLAAFALPITVVAAAFSYRFVERPIRAEGFLASARRVLVPWRFGARAVAASVIALVLIVGGSTATGLAIANDTGVSALEAQLAESKAAIAAAERQQRADALEAKREAAATGAEVAPPSGADITAIGDSVMLAAAPELQKVFPGIAIDAVVSRQFADGPAAVQAAIDAGTLRPILVLGLGTNGPIDAGTLEQIKAMLPRETLMVVVNVHAPRGWIAGNNQIIESFAKHERTVELSNWHDAIQPRLDVLSRDGVHPGGPIGGQIYAFALQDALQRLAEIPPLLDPNDYGLAPRPV